MITITERAKKSLKTISNKEKTKNIIYRVIKEGFG